MSFSLAALVALFALSGGAAHFGEEAHGPGDVAATSDAAVAATTPERVRCEAELVVLVPPSSSDATIDSPRTRHSRHLPMTAAEVFEVDDDFERIERLLVLVALLASAPDYRDLRVPRATGVDRPRGVLLDGARSLRGPPVSV